MHDICISYDFLRQERNRWSLRLTLSGPIELAREGDVLFGQHFDTFPDDGGSYCFVFFSGRGRYSRAAYERQIRELVQELRRRGYQVTEWDVVGPDDTADSLASAQAWAAFGATVLLSPAVYRAAREAGLSVSRSYGGLPCLGRGR